MHATCGLPTFCDDCWWDRLRQFEQCASGILNPDNNIRRAAEGTLDRLRSASFDKYLLLLAQALAQSTMLEVRQFCAVVLRQVSRFLLFPHSLGGIC